MVAQTPLLLTAMRLLLFFRVEADKSVLAPGAQELVERLQRRRRWLEQPSTYLLFISISIIPAIATLVIHELGDGTWTRRLANTKNGTRCAFFAPRVVLSAYFLVGAVIAVWFYFKLKQAKENFGVKQMFMRLVSTSSIGIILWLLLSNFLLIEAQVFANITSCLWALFSVYVPLRQHYRDWEPASEPIITPQQFPASKAEVKQVVTRQRAQTRHNAAVALLGSDLVPLEVVLADPALRVDFTKFIQAEFSGENLLFLQAVDRFRPSATREDARALIEMYVLDSSPLQVNISNAARRSLLAFYSGAPDKADIELGPVGAGAHSALFDTAASEIRALVEGDTLRRFLLQRSGQARR
eukprot:TRINITY_DN442_c0_g1_i8.p1 TRINITY_DN442_c0_g1~~TRINITY_DN442_c0_g1_i8.p1  ORF type:complete len:355 (-),score=68.39 TRINITY_DN442_c0_g1_i8:37-1101(-)